MATHDKFLRQIPCRLVGEARDRNGKRGFVLTLSTREQHIRREKATSNICTNQGLVALMCGIYMTVYGREGLKELATQNLAKAHYASEQFKKSGAKLLFEGAPRFNEFVIETKADPYAINDKLLGERIIGGFPLKKFYPELNNASLWCCTETTAKASIDAVAKEVAL
jgi:glycine dehydrogenase subunit 1